MYFVKDKQKEGDWILEGKCYYMALMRIRYLSGKRLKRVGISNEVIYYFFVDLFSVYHFCCSQWCVRESNH